MEQCVDLSSRCHCWVRDHTGRNSKDCMALAHIIIIKT